MQSLLKVQSYFAASASRAGSLRGPLLVSGVALMAGLLVSSAAQAQCTGGENQKLFPFGAGGGVNAFTSVIGTVNSAFLPQGSAFVTTPGGVAPDAQGGGVWTRTIGGTADTTASSKSIGELTVVYSNGPKTHQVNGNCETKVRQDFGGFQAGRDIAILNYGSSGANLHIGTTVGYVEAKISDVTPGIGTLKGNFQVPSAGVYGAFAKGGFYADAQARFDYFQGELNDPTANGLFNQRTDARGYSLTANAGYRFGLGNNWFVEPSAGGVYSRVSADPFDVSGTGITSSGESFPGTVQIQDFDSLIGRVSARVGASFELGGGSVIAQPFFATSVFHEFAGNVNTTISIGPPFGPGTLSMSTSRAGTYAQFGVGSAFRFVNSGWFSYARVDYKTGDTIDGVSVNAGMRYQINQDTASPKDEDSLKDIPWASVNWTGLYAGGSVGATAGEENWLFPRFNRSGSPDFAGYLLGGDVGYNYQFNRFVVGIEGDYDFSNSRGGQSCDNDWGSGLYWSCEAGIGGLGALTGRLGYTWGRTLFYAKGGWAFGEVSARLRENTNPTLAWFPTVAVTKWANGWTVGGGMEIALSDNWSAKAEYMHYDLGKENFEVAPPRYVPHTLKANTGTAGDTVRVGVNYHLSPLTAQK